MKRTVSVRRRFAIVAVICLIAFAAGIFTTIGSAKKAAADDNASAAAFSVDYGDDNVIDYDLSDADSAHEYVDSYADNLGADPDFKDHVSQAIATVREDVPAYASFLALLAPIIAIVLALITKEVYSSLVIGIIVGGLIYAGGNLEVMLTHVVCDGFTGNVILKLTEGFALHILGLLKARFTEGTKAKIGALLLKDKLRSLKGEFDYSEYGGAPILGVKGAIVKMHGSSNANAVKNTVLKSIPYVEEQVVDKIQNSVLDIEEIVNSEREE